MVDRLRRHLLAPPLGQRAGRRVTLILTVLALVILAGGSLTTVQLLADKREGLSYNFTAWTVTWPFTCGLFAMLALAALWTAGRMRDGIIFLAWLLLGDLCIWVIWVMVIATTLRVTLGWGNHSTSAAFAILVIVVFDAGALYFVRRYLLRGGPNAILGS